MRDLWNKIMTMDLPKEMKNNVEYAYNPYQGHLLVASSDHTSNNRRYLPAKVICSVNNPAELWQKIHNTKVHKSFKNLIVASGVDFQEENFAAFCLFHELAHIYIDRTTQKRTLRKIYRDDLRAYRKLKYYRKKSLEYYQAYRQLPLERIADSIALHCLKQYQA